MWEKLLVRVWKERRNGTYGKEARVVGCEREDHSPFEIRFIFCGVGEKRREAKKKEIARETTSNMICNWSGQSSLVWSYGEGS